MDNEIVQALTQKLDALLEMHNDLQQRVEDYQDLQIDTDAKIANRLLALEKRQQADLGDLEHRVWQLENAR